MKLNDLGIKYACELSKSLDENTYQREIMVKTRTKIRKSYSDELLIQTRNKVWKDGTVNKRLK